MLLSTQITYVCLRKEANLKDFNSQASFAFKRRG
jgi:hypothetical protein